MADLIELVRSIGTLEQGEHDLTGPPLLRRADVFGARDWFVLNGDTVWYVQERGGIGYARNVTSDGIRATGWAVPSDKLADAVGVLVAAARALQVACRALGLPWQDVARRRRSAQQVGIGPLCTVRSRIAASQKVAGSRRPNS